MVNWSRQSSVIFGWAEYLTIDGIEIGNVHPRGDGKFIFAAFADGIGFVARSASDLTRCKALALSDLKRRGLSF